MVIRPFSRIYDTILLVMISCFASAGSTAADVVLDFFSVLIVVGSDDDVVCYDLTP